MIAVNRFDICLINLDPTLGSEIQKVRPCVVISPDSMNHSRLKTIIIAPMTSTIKEHFPTRVDLEFNEKKGQIALDQLRVINRVRLIKPLGKLDSKTSNAVLEVLKALFN